MEDLIIHLIWIQEQHRDRDAKSNESEHVTKTQGNQKIPKANASKNKTNIEILKPKKA